MCYNWKQQLLHSNAPLKGIVLLDWGCGSGKWILFSNRFLGIEMKCVGFECVRNIFDICSTNLVAAQTHGLGRNSRALLVQSESFQTFCPARIIVNYDGGPQKAQQV